MEQKTAQQKAEERYPSPPWDGHYSTGYATCHIEEVEPRDRILQELVDALANVSKESEGIGTIVCNCGAAATGIQLATNSALAKAKEQFGIEPSNQK